MTACPSDASRDVPCAALIRSLVFLADANLPGQYHFEDLRVTECATVVLGGQGSRKTCKDVCTKNSRNSWSYPPLILACSSSCEFMFCALDAFDALAACNYHAAAHDEAYRSSICSPIIINVQQSCVYGLSALATKAAVDICSAFTVLHTRPGDVFTADHILT